MSAVVEGEVTQKNQTDQGAKTFITQDENKNKKEEDSLLMDKPEIVYIKDRLNNCVDNIEPQFEKVLANHEKDFVQAYKVSNFQIILTLLPIGPHD